MTNSSFLTPKNLSYISQEIFSYLVKESNKSSGKKNFLARNFPEWTELGKVFFHLAENPALGQNNFVFLASYTHQISDAAKVSHLTFEKALFDNIKDQSKTKQLLQPITTAAKKVFSERIDFSRKALWSLYFHKR